jgi:hypothetical protein
MIVFGGGPLDVRREVPWSRLRTMDRDHQAARLAIYAYNVSLS